MTGARVEWTDSVGERHWLDDQGYCWQHQHLLPHGTVATEFAHLHDCEGFAHPGRTCDEVAYDMVEAE